MLYGCFCFCFYPLPLTASLVMTTFLTQPKQSSSRVHSRCFFIAAGLISPLEFEKMMGAATPLLALLENVWVKPPVPVPAPLNDSLWLKLLEKGPLASPHGGWVLRPWQLRFLDSREKPVPQPHRGDLVARLSS